MESIILAIGPFETDANRLCNVNIQSFPTGPAMVKQTVVICARKFTLALPSRLTRLTPPDLSLGVICGEKLRPTANR